MTYEVFYDDTKGDTQIILFESDSQDYDVVLQQFHDWCVPPVRVLEVRRVEKETA